MAIHSDRPYLLQMVTSSRDFKTDTEWNYYRFEGPMATRTLKGNHRFEHVDGKGSTARYELIILDGFPSKVCFIFQTNQAMD